MKQIDDGAGDELPGVIKVIGIGQSLRGDDAAGLVAVRLWQESFHPLGMPPGVLLEQAELPGVGLLSMLQGTSCAILVDAVRSGARPGTIHRVTEDQLESFGAGSGSVHGWGIAETLALGRQLVPAELPSTLIVIGIEAGKLGLGETLSPEVDAALPEVSRLIEECVRAALLPPQH